MALITETEEKALARIFVSLVGENWHADFKREKVYLLIAKNRPTVGSMSKGIILKRTKLKPFLIETDVIMPDVTCSRCDVAIHSRRGFITTRFRYYYSRISCPPFGRIGITAFPTWNFSRERENLREAPDLTTLRRHLIASGRLSPFSRARFFSFSSLTSGRHFAAKALSWRFGQLVRAEKHFAM